MKRTFSFFLILVVFSVSGCFSYNSSVPKSYKENPFYLSSNWLKTKESEITKKMTTAIRQRHPHTTEWFPRLRINSIETADTITTENINRILSNVRNELLPKNKTAITWDARLTISSGEQKYPKVAQALVIPAQIAMCFPSLAMVCPGGETNIVLLTAELTTHSGEKIYIQGTGASDYWALSPYAADNEDYNAKSKTQAFIAALTSLVDNIVSYVESKKLKLLKESMTNRNNNSS